jgi:hypothetical protein
MIPPLLSGKDGKKKTSQTMKKMRLLSLNPFTASAADFPVSNKD